MSDLELIKDALAHILINQIQMAQQEGAEIDEEATNQIINELQTPVKEDAQAGGKLQ